MTRLDVIPVGELQVNCYILSSPKTKNAIIIDPGDDYPKIRSFLDQHKLIPKFIVHTHGHIDHIQADDEFGLTVYAHKLDVELLKDSGKNLSSFLSLPFKVSSTVKPLEDGEKIALDDMSLEVIHTPGHTPGGICLRTGNIVLTGDTLFAGGVGRTDFPGASGRQLIKSIKDRLFVLPDETLVYPGHGPASSIGEEKRDNPFLR